MEKTQKITKKILEKSGNPRGNGILRLKVIEILFLFNSLSLTEIKQKMAGEFPSIDRRTLNAIVKELQLCPVPGYELKMTQKRAGKTRCTAYNFIKIKKPCLTN